MKKIIVLLIVLMLGLSFGDSYAQKFKLNVIGGYSLPLPDLKGTFPDDANANKNPMPYMMKNGFNVGGIGKYYFDKKNSVGMTLSLVYNSFSNTVDDKIIVIEGGYNLSSVKFKMNMFQVGLGGEYRVPVKGAVIPFFDLDLTASFFSGDIKSTQVNDGIERERTLKSASRFGFNVGAGVEFIASSKISFVVGGKYQYFNLLGKEDYTAPTDTEYSLNDKEYSNTLLDGSSDARNIMALQIYGGINFNLDQIFK